MRSKETEDKLRTMFRDRQSIESYSAERIGVQDRLAYTVVLGISESEKKMLGKNNGSPPFLHNGCVSYTRALIGFVLAIKQ